MGVEEKGRKACCLMLLLVVLGRVVRDVVMHCLQRPDGAVRKVLNSGDAIVRREIIEIWVEESDGHMFLSMTR